MESFFALLQNNVLDWQSWKTRKDLTVTVFKWIETTYGRRRRQGGRGRMTPLEFETATVRHTAIATSPTKQLVNRSLGRRHERSECQSEVQPSLNSKLGHCHVLRIEPPSCQFRLRTPSRHGQTEESVWGATAKASTSSLQP